MQPRRRHPTHGVLHVDGQPTILFDTVCTKDRRSWAACDAVHDLLRDVWLRADTWRAGRYVVMPDHVHYFAACAEKGIRYKNWVQYWKSQFSKEWQHPECRWQTDNWETRIRSFEAYEEKWRYMLENPVRRRLVAKPEDWPYPGVIYELRWD